MSDDSAKPDYKQHIDRKIGEHAEVFDIGAGAYAAGKISEWLSPLWFLLGDLESDFRAPALEKIPVENPVYVCGLARGGTTITLELLYKSGVFGSYTYQYYPFIAFPLVWHAVAKHFLTTETRPRIHFDRIDVHADSPEALEEMLWLHFFPKTASGRCFSALLDERTDNPRFKKFYRNSIRKILMISGKGRYLAKGNYNLLRIPYIRKINPSAKFIVLIREPSAHIASLIKQHYLFGKIGNPRVVDYMRRIGHYEFGPHRLPVDCGETGGAEEIAAAWRSGDEIGGWAMLWRNCYAFLQRRILSDPALKDSVLMVRYEDLCADPVKKTREISAFCNIPEQPDMMRFAKGISAPDYYKSGLTREDEARIAEITGKVRALFY